MKDKDYYLSEYIKVEQNSVYQAYKEGCFGDLTEGQKEFMECYRNASPTMENMKPLWDNQTYRSITNKMDCFDSNDIISSYSASHLTNDFHVGYWLFWYGKDGLNYYAQNSNDLNSTVGRELKRLCCNG